MGVQVKKSGRMADTKRIMYYALTTRRKWKPERRNKQNLGENARREEQR
jgi:hypothetical protein